MLPGDVRAKNVLEIYMLGGVSQYESFYCVDKFGADPQNPSQWHLFLASGDVQAAMDACSFPANYPLLQKFGKDSKGNEVSLGPFVAPLRGRDDILQRLRICITAHDFLPHEVAIPIALTGRPPGSPAGAGLGAHIQRFFLDTRGPTSTGAPYSYALLASSSVQTELSGSVVAT
ncbi:MAG TPA: hypothetical protein VHB21_03200, partial [Minicystis sp.]|nr:hypothetical protein [Minicystis sp.]